MQRTKAREQTNLNPMKLTRLTDEQHLILKRVVEEYYVVLPPALKVHSLFATHILSETLHHYGIRTRVLPCRLWCSQRASEREFVGGFVNFGDREKWNGHVVCLVGEWLVDAALYHLNPTFNYQVPSIVARRIAMPEPGIYARYRLDKHTEFIWYRLPPEVPAIPLEGYEEHMDHFVATLVRHVNALLGIEKTVEAVEAVTESAEQPVSEAVDADAVGNDAAAGAAAPEHSAEFGEAGDAEGEDPGPDPEEPSQEAEASEEAAMPEPGTEAAESGTLQPA